jgi:leucyl/phenylalanyl-tRNA--protein transferase
MIGGLYGVSLGKAFFGESMFFKKNDASKVALYYLCRELEKWGFHFIDAQVETDHLLSLGAEKIDRDDFLDRLQTAQESPTCMGKWTKNLII